MSDAALESRVLELLVGVAPDVDSASLQPEVDFRYQFDFDSMDQLNFATAIHDALGIDVPERDYRELGSLRRCVDYLTRRMASTKPADV